MKFSDAITNRTERMNDTVNQAMADINELNDLYKGNDEKWEQSHIIDIDIEELRDNPNNHFSRLEGEDWNEFVGSIKENGILQPLLVRKKDNEYEILAGHNRKYGAIQAGFKSVPCKVLDVDDVEASVIVAVTNKQRETTTDREWGWAYRTTYEAIKSTRGGDRKSNFHNESMNATDEDKSNFHDESMNATDEDKSNFHDESMNATDEGKSNFHDESMKDKDAFSKVAEKYGVSQSTVFRKIRLTYLEEALYMILKKNNYSQKVMKELSYLPKLTQMNISTAIDEGTVITDEIAERIIEESKNKKETTGGELTIDEIFRICSIEIKPQEITEKIKKYPVNDNLFPKEIKKKQRGEYIVKALTYIIENGIEL